MKGSIGIRVRERNYMTFGLGVLLGMLLCVLFTFTARLPFLHHRPFSASENLLVQGQRAALKRVFKVSNFLRITGYVPPAAHVRSPAFSVGKVQGYDTVIDVGGFDCRDYTLPGFQTGYTVYSFELDEKNQQKCLKTFASAGLVQGKDFTIIDVVPGTLPPVITSPKLPHIYFFKAGVSKSALGVSVAESKELAMIGGQGNLPVVPLDGVIPDQANVFILKSDTQGHELNVFIGAERILKKGAHSLFLEFWPEGAKKHGLDMKTLLEYLYDFGYQCFDTGFHSYNTLARPAEIHEYTQRLIDAELREDVIGSWDDLVCSRFDA